jgi:hypothetical protein
MAFASWIPASQGAGVPRIGMGLFTNGAAPQWSRQIGLPIKMFGGYTGFDTLANMPSNAYYSVSVPIASGGYFAPATGVIPVIGTSLATKDGTMSLAGNAAGTYDATWQQMMTNLFYAYNTIILRLNYEANIETTPGGYTSGNTAWGPAFQAAFQHVAQVIYAKVATFSGKTLYIAFDTCPLNYVDANNTLLKYKPGASYYDILSMDLYSGNCYPVTNSNWPGYAAETPFTLNATANATGSTSDNNLWATDFNAAATQGGQGYTYNNMGHYLCFPDGKDAQPNGGQGNSLYYLIQNSAIADQKPIMHSEFGGVGLIYTNGVVSGGNAGVDLATQPIASHGNAVNGEAACNDLNYFPYMKRAWAAIEAMGVPVLGAVVWDKGGGNILSGPDPSSGPVHPGMRSGVQVFGYPIGHYGATDPIIVITELPSGGIPPNQSYTVQVDTNYAVTLNHFTVDLGAGAGQATIPGSPSIVGTNSFQFTFTPVTSGTFNMVVEDTSLGYKSPPTDYIVTGSASGGGSTPPPVTVTPTTAQQDYQTLAALGKTVCVSEFRPGTVTAGDTTFSETTLISTLQTQMPDAVFWQQYWDTNPSGAGWGLASVQNAAAALNLPWVLNRSELSLHSVPPTAGLQTEQLTVYFSDASTFIVTKLAGTTITNQTYQ